MIYLPQQPASTTPGPPPQPVIVVAVQPEKPLHKIDWNALTLEDVWSFVGILCIVIIGTSILAYWLGVADFIQETLSNWSRRKMARDQLLTTEMERLSKTKTDEDRARANMRLEVEARKMEVDPPKIT